MVRFVGGGEEYVLLKLSDPLPSLRPAALPSSTWTFSCTPPEPG